VRCRQRIFPSISAEDSGHYSINRAGGALAYSILALIRFFDILSGNSRLFQRPRIHPILDYDSTVLQLLLQAGRRLAGDCNQHMLVMSGLVGEFF